MNSKADSKKKINNPEIPSEQKQTNEKTLKINTSRSRSDLTLIKHLCAKNGWKEVFNIDGDILFSGLIVPNEDLSIATEILINRIPGMDELAHKKTTGFFLNKYREYFPNEYDFFPRTFLYPEQEEEFVEFFKKNGKNNKVFIAKPTIGGEGDGIFLITKLSDLPSKSSFVGTPELVIQEYINNPLIIDDKKFDLRVFVLVASVEPLIAFVADEGLARFATEDYQPVSKENLKNVFMHLTNYSLNKLSPKFVYSEELTEIHSGSKRSLTSLWKSLRKLGFDVGLIQEKIGELISKFLKSIHAFLLFNYKSTFGKENGKCFQLLGFDILLDENLKPWLLEINNNPSLNIFHDDVSLESNIREKLTKKEKDPNEEKKEEQQFLKGQSKMLSAEYVKNKMKINAVISPIDLHVKATVLEDTFLLMTGGPKFMKKITESYRGMKLVFSEEKHGLLNQDVFKVLLEIYGKLSGSKFKNSITAGKFIKLANLRGMTNENVTKTSYDLIFTKALRNSSDCKNMDFFMFIEVFELLVSKLCPDYQEKDKLPAMCKVAKNVKDQLE